MMSALTRILARALLIAPFLVGLPASAQNLFAQRLPINQLDVMAPSERVGGAPGNLAPVQRQCLASTTQASRRRIVDVAVQEWGYFGFNVVDQTGPEPPRPAGPRPRRRTPWLNPGESERVAESIAGYWSITPDGPWIIDRQNALWRGPDGIGARWRDPWSAAFISWVMCESGLATSGKFAVAIAHHTYIDQAIRERDSGSGAAAYRAFEVGETIIEPGDLLCSAWRHAYRSLDDRRRNIGEGVRSHCDIVVHIDPSGDRILAIGGNVRGTVSLKLLYAPVVRKAGNAAEPLHETVGRGRSTAFAHLKLLAPSLNGPALLGTPTVRNVAARPDQRRTLEARLGIEVPAKLDES